MTWAGEKKYKWGEWKSGTQREQIERGVSGSGQSHLSVTCFGLTPRSLPSLVIANMFYTELDDKQFLFCFTSCPFIIHSLHKGVIRGRSLEMKVVIQK